MDILESFTLSYAQTTLDVFQFLLALGVRESTLEWILSTYL
ncbi:hypothetical protein [Corynebacterium halotolerans]